MLESKHFRFNHIHSQDMGVFIARTNKGLYQESFLPQRKIVETKVANRNKPYFQRVELEPLSFKLSFVILDWDNLQALRRVAKWLFTDTYKPLVFSSNPDRVFYAMVEGEPSLLHNGAKEGFVELTFRCDSPFSYSTERNFDNVEFRSTNKGAVVASDFTKGDMTNVINTSNGLTLEKIDTTWGALYKTTKTWGELT